MVEIYWHRIDFHALSDQPFECERLRRGLVKTADHFIHRFIEYISGISVCWHHFQIDFNLRVSQNKSTSRNQARQQHI